MLAPTTAICHPTLWPDELFAFGTAAVIVQRLDAQSSCCVEGIFDPMRQLVNGSVCNLTGPSCSCCIRSAVRQQVSTVRPSSVRLRCSSRSMSMDLSNLFFLASVVGLLLLVWQRTGGAPVTLRKKRRNRVVRSAY